MRGEAEADILEREADEGMGSASDAGSGAGRGGGSDSDDKSDCASAVTGEDEGPPSVGGLLDDDAFAASEADDLGEPDEAMGDSAAGGAAGGSGGAGSSGDAVAPPPLPPPAGAPPRPARARPQARPAHSVLHLPGGKLTLYTGGKKDFWWPNATTKGMGAVSKPKPWSRQLSDLPSARQAKAAL